MKTLDEYLKLPYPMEIVEDQEEGGYTISFPDLPGCITCGETIEKAVDNGKEEKVVAGSCYGRGNINSGT